MLKREKEGKKVSISKHQPFSRGYTVEDGLARRYSLHKRQRYPVEQAVHFYAIINLAVPWLFKH